MSELPDREARERATDISGSYIVQAPAGSGKTSLLVTRYLKLLAVAEQPEEVLAITFTVKAAGEMRERVLEALADPNSIVNPEAAHMARARDEAAGWQLARHPLRLRIQTIDSFAAGLLRRLPHHLDEPARFNPSPDADGLLREAAERTLHRLHAADPVTEHVLHMLDMFDGNATSLVSTLVQMLASRDQWMTPLAQVLGTGAEDAGELVRILDENVGLLVSRYQAEFDAAAGDVLTGEWRWCQAHLGASGFPDLAQHLVRKDGKLRKQMRSAEGFTTRAERARAKDLLTTLHEHGLATLIEDCALLPAGSMAAETPSIMSVAVVLFTALEELQQVFTHHNHTDFTELTIAAERALGRCGSPTELALALDHRIRHILVDEFQDTSLAQLRLFEKLTDHWHPEANETFFAVGDPMQSIYRFRDADVSRFLEVQASGIGDLPLEPLTLTCNFRSAGALVDWCNTVFSSVFGPLNDTTSGRVAHAPSRSTRSEAGSVSVRTFEDRQAEAEGAAQTIAGLCRAEPDARIGVLVRNRPNAAALMQELRREGVSWQASDMQRLAGSQIAADVAAALAVITGYQHGDAWLTLLRAPFVGVSLIELERIGTAPDIESAIAATHNLPHVQRLYRSVEEARRSRDEVPPRECVETLLYHAGAQDAYEPAEQANLEKLLVVIDQLGGSGLEVQAFEQAISGLYAAETGASNVEIMTIHKAKGLEFDHVVIPFLDRTGRPSTTPPIHTRNVGDTLYVDVKHGGLFPWLNALESQSEAAELARLLYVACTRARRTLHISWSSDRPERRSLAWLLKPHVASQHVDATAKHGHTSALRNARLPVGYSGQPDLTAPTSTWSAAQPAPEDDNLATVVGTLYHEQLEQLAHSQPVSGASTLRGALQKRGVAPDAAAEQAERMHATLTAIVEDETGQWILAPRSSAATELTVAGVDDHGHPVRRRFDRMFVDRGARWIIDYKTRASETTDDTEIRSQLRAYRTLAEAIWPERVRTAVYFLEERRLEEIA